MAGLYHWLVNQMRKQVKAIAGDTDEGVLVSEQSMVSSTEMKTSRKSVHVSYEILVFKIEVLF